LLFVFVKNALIAFWNTGREFGELVVTVGGIVEFILILLLSYVVSSLIRTLLREEFLDRMELPRGVPMAISSLTFYLLIVIGFLLALASLGFGLDKLGILAGALGVGIGFGLQGIVNNFLSGLILVFERPITEGDIVIVDDVSGKVVKIGIRSSRIRKWDGSEMIIPNADLISNKVINWTRGEYKRRFTIRFETDTSVNPTLVQETVDRAVMEVPGVFQNPKPTTYFEGLEGEAFLFALYYWLPGEDFAIKSAVQNTFHAALKEQNIPLKTGRNIYIQNPNESETRE
jgi:small-conductance mechanosensitive channel